MNSMHSYATNSPHNVRLTLILASISTGLASLVGWLAHWVELKYGYHIAGASSLVSFGTLYFVFNKWAWKLPLLRHVLLVPDLNGNWACQGHTVKRGGKDAPFDWSAEVTIVQSWSSISILQKSDQSKSGSIAASLYHTPGDGYRLIFHYANDPNADEVALRHHTGLCDLTFNEDLTAAKGDYFTDHHRATTGTMKLIRKANP